jgi:RHS repeat-associated protein
VAATYQYDAFGAVKTTTGTADSDWRFTGELQDSQVARGLYYLRARYYDPALGRFLSRDG